MDKIKVSLIDSRTVYREGVRTILSTERDIEVTDESQQDEGIFSRLEAISPDVVILSIKSPIANSLKLAREIRRQFPRVPVILLGETEDDELLFQGIKVGAAAYVTNEVSPVELTDVIRKTFHGEYLINESLATNPQVASRVTKFFQDLSQAERGIEYLLAPLSPREVQTLNCIAQGNSNKGIGRILGISEQTVKNHVSSILRKLVANDRTHAVVIALRQGLIKID